LSNQAGGGEPGGYFAVQIWGSERRGQKEEGGKNNKPPNELHEETKKIAGSKGAYGKTGTWSRGPKTREGGTCVLELQHGGGALVQMEKNQGEGSVGGGQNFSSDDSKKKVWKKKNRRERGDFGWALEWVRWVS